MVNYSSPFQFVSNWRKQWMNKKKKWSKIRKKHVRAPHRSKMLRGRSSEGGGNGDGQEKVSPLLLSANQSRRFNCFHAAAEVAGKSTRSSGWYKRAQLRAVKSLSPVILPDANTTANHDGTFERVGSFSSLCRRLPCWRYLVDYCFQFFFCRSLTLLLLNIWW